MRLTARWRKVVLTVHVATSVGWLGVDLVLLTLGITGLTGWRPEVVYPAMGYVGLALFVPLSFLVWLVGVFNAWTTPWGVLRHWWVIAKLSIVSLMLVLVVFALRPNLVAALEVSGSLGNPYRRSLVIAPAVSSTLLVIATTLSMFKPWGRRT
jgi:hypothetical protein